MTNAEMSPEEQVFSIAKPVEFLPNMVVDNIHQFDAIQNKLNIISDVLSEIREEQSIVRKDIFSLETIQRTNILNAADSHKLLLGFQLEIKDQITTLGDNMAEKMVNLFNGVGSLKETHLKTSDEISKLLQHQTSVNNDLSVLHNKSDELAKVIDSNHAKTQKMIRLILITGGVLAMGILVIGVKLFLRG